MGLYALTKNWQLSLKDYYFRAIHPRPSRRGILAVFRKLLIYSERQNFSTVLVVATFMVALFYAGVKHGAAKIYIYLYMSFIVFKIEEGRGNNFIARVDDRGESVK